MTRTMDETPVLRLPGTPSLTEWRAVMDTVHADVVAGRRPDSALIFEPGEAFTQGKHSTPEEWTPGLPWVELDRGGRASWMGPGQVMVVPVVRMFDQGAIVARGWGSEVNTIGRAVDRLAAIVHQKRLEEVGIVTAGAFGVKATRMSGSGLGGVWVPADDGGPARKLGNVGTRIAKGVTSHGLGLNVCPDLSVFDRFTLCGLGGVRVTSLEVEAGRTVTVEEVLPVFTAAVVKVFGLEATWTCDKCGAFAFAHDGGTCPRDARG